MDSIVQFIRNALCVCKDLELFRTTFLWDPTIPIQYYDLPEPFNKTTPLEIMISIAQLYVVYSGIPNGFQMMTSNYYKVQRIERLMKKYGTAIINDIDRIINLSLLKEANDAIRNMFIGFNVFFIACSFVWLASNSWHITETLWIGGIVGLIHALTVMNICLMPLLYYMYKDGTAYFTKANQMEQLVLQLQLTVTETNKKGNTIMMFMNPADVTLPIFELLASTTSSTTTSLEPWVPFFGTGIGFLEALTTSTTPTSLHEYREEKLMEQEKHRIKKIFDMYCTSTTSQTPTPSSGATTTEKAPFEQLMMELETNIPIVKMYGYREYLYLVLNFIAWYGYSACIVVYYYNNETIKPLWVQYLLFKLNNIDADFYGNLAGDCMWTIEPIIALTSPYYFKSILQQKQKQRREMETTPTPPPPTTTSTSIKTKKEL